MGGQPGVSCGVPGRAAAAAGLRPAARALRAHQPRPRPLPGLARRQALRAPHGVPEEALRGPPGQPGGQGPAAVGRGNCGGRGEENL